jgi:hypothetical protein
LEKIHAQVVELPGDIAEVGVYRGDSAERLCEVFPDVCIHLFDTFCGMPENDEGYKETAFANTSEEEVKTRLRDKRIKTYAGIFPNTVHGCDCELFKFVHCDVDLYTSTRDVLAWFWPRLVSGGVLLCDDYGCCRGAKRAVDEFAEEHDVEFVHARFARYVIKNDKDSG